MTVAVPRTRYLARSRDRSPVAAPAGTDQASTWCRTARRRVRTCPRRTRSSTSRRTSTCPDCTPSMRWNRRQRSCLQADRQREGCYVCSLFTLPPARSRSRSHSQPRYHYHSSITLGVTTVRPIKIPESFAPMLHSRHEVEPGTGENVSSGQSVHALAVPFLSENLPAVATPWNVTIRTQVCMPQQRDSDSDHDNSSSESGEERQKANINYVGGHESATYPLRIECTTAETPSSTFPAHTFGTGRRLWRTCQHGTACTARSPCRE